MAKYDAFLSYASENEQIASEIVGSLKSKGFKIWYAPLTLNVGEKLLDSIEDGLKNSNSGILLISKEYINKGWTNYELDILLRDYIEKSKNLFPIWHEISREAIDAWHRGLAGICALDTNLGLPMLSSKLTHALSKFAPTVLCIPEYESPAFRFLNGEGEATIGEHGLATTLWELLIYAKDTAYPIFLDGELYDKEYLLWQAAQLLPCMVEEVRNWVGKDGYDKIWSMCVEAGMDPKIYG